MDYHNTRIRPIKLFQKSPFLSSERKYTFNPRFEEFPRHLKQYSRERANDSRLGTRSEAIDGKETRITSRTELTRHRSLTVIFSALLHFDSLRLRRRKWKSKQKSVESTGCTPWKRRFPETIFQRGSPPSLARENRNRRRSCSLKSTRRHIRGKDRWSSMIDILKKLFAPLGDFISCVFFQSTLNNFLTFRFFCFIVSLLENVVIAFWIF